MKPVLFTRADADKFTAAQNDIIGIIVANLDKLFKISVSVSMEKIEGGKAKLIFTYPFEDTQLMTQYVYLPAELAANLFPEK